MIDVKMKNKIESLNLFAELAVQFKHNQDGLNKRSPLPRFFVYSQLGTRHVVTSGFDPEVGHRIPPIQVSVVGSFVNYIIT